MEKRKIFFGCFFERGKGKKLLSTLIFVKPMASQGRNFVAGRMTQKMDFLWEEFSLFSILCKEELGLWPAKLDKISQLDRSVAQKKSRGSTGCKRPWGKTRQRSAFLCLLFLPFSRSSAFFPVWASIDHSLQIYASDSKLQGNLNNTGTLGKKLWQFPLTTVEQFIPNFIAYRHCWAWKSTYLIIYFCSGTMYRCLCLWISGSLAHYCR